MIEIFHYLMFWMFERVLKKVVSIIFEAFSLLKYLYVMTHRFLGPEVSRGYFLCLSHVNQCTMLELAMILV